MIFISFTGNNQFNVITEILRKQKYIYIINFYRFQLTALLLLAASARSDKQIKLEDIEKDNLKAAQQAKYEKQYQQYQSYSPSPVQYDQQTYSQPGLTYQNPSGYSQLYVPQQYLQPSAYSGIY